MDFENPLAQAVADRADATPALTWRGCPTSYAELAERMRSWVARLRGLAPGPVGLRAEKSPGAVGLILGCLAAGRAVLLAPPGLPALTVKDLFQRAGCVHLLNPDGTVTPGPANGEILEAEPASIMLTTSGSTGTPKIVPLGAAAIERFSEWAHGRFDLGAGRRVLNYAPLNFDLCLLEIWATLRYGGQVIMVEPSRSASGRAMADLLAHTAPQVLQAVPMLYEVLLADGGPGPIIGAEHVIVTGDALCPARVAGLHRLFGQARLYNVYGCTETNDSFLHEIDPAHDPSERIPLGEPLPGVRAVLVRADGTELHGLGVGELLVSTPFQTTGYRNTPGSEGKFRTRDGRRYFVSGDLVRRRADGSLVLEGRTDFQVKVRGQQVNLQEVEQVLIACADVLEVAAVAVPDPRAGQRLHAEVRRALASDLNSLVLRRHCADRLPSAAIPSTLRITDAPLPRTATGKVDRTRIRASIDKVE